MRIKVHDRWNTVNMKGPTMAVGVVILGILLAVAVVALFITVGVVIGLNSRHN